MQFFYVSRRYAFGIRAGRAAIAVGDTPRENEKAGRIGAHAPIARPKAPRIGLRPIAVFHKTKLFHERDTGIAVARMTGFGCTSRRHERYITFCHLTIRHKIARACHRIASRLIG